MAEHFVTVGCSLPGCKMGLIKEGSSKVEVKAYDPGSKSGLWLNWREGGEATFHSSCWGRVRRVFKGDHSDGLTPVRLSDLESSLISEAKKTAEYHNSSEEVIEAADAVTRLLQNAKYTIAFTGAGISTAAGIGDFRGKDGKWTNQAKAKAFGSKSRSNGGRGYRMIDLRPTYTHEALVKLIDMGLLKYVISQNTDGLHRLSGVPAHSLSELHGNAFIEKCELCGSRYTRTASVRQGSTAVPPKPCEHCRINHRTGRMCSQQGCRGYLMNTIINFGDNLEEDVLDSAKTNARCSDLVLCLGTSLTVSPANSLVTMGTQPPRLIICNRQPTSFDDLCTVMGPDGQALGSRVFTDCDKLMRLVMARLLSAEELQQWESGRGQRLGEYAQQRVE